MGQSVPESNGNEGLLGFPQSSKASDGLISYPGNLFGVGVLPLCRDAVGVFYSSS